jgi:hypothetical protein
LGFTGIADGRFLDLAVRAKAAFLLLPVLDFAFEADFRGFDPGILLEL